MELFGNLKLKQKIDDPGELRTFGLDKETTSERIVPQEWYRDHGGITSIPYELTQIPSEELELIRSYRELAASAEVDEALQEIRNEIFIFDVPQKKAFELDFAEESELSDSIKKKVNEEFNYLYNLIDFDTVGIQWFDDWFVDSKLYLHKIIDQNRPKLGIKKVNVIDPLKIRKLRVVPTPDPDGTYDISQVKNLYVYSNFDHRTQPLGQPIQIYHGQHINGMQIAEEAITYVHSGLFDRSLGRYVGYLKKAILPFNNLKMMEDAMVIFRVVRAPSRRAFYVDVSGLQKNRAEAYMKDLMSKFKNKMVYNTKTGTLSDRRNIMSMTEDYWLPRRDGQRGTEITTIEGQTAQEILEEVEYFRDKLWRALGVPRGRFGQDQQSFVFGKGVEIQRDEYRFGRFLATLRSRFIVFMEDLLKTQLVLKKIIKPSEWEEVRHSILWQYTEDNAFVEYKESEILTNRMNSLSALEPHIGKYYSRNWVKKNVLRLTDEEIKTMDEEIEEERKEELKRQKEEGGDPEQGQFGGDNQE